MAEMFEYLREFHVGSIFLRLFLAALLGGLIGLERGKKRRPAGFRTYMMVCMGSAASMVLSQYLNHLIANDWAPYLATLNFNLNTDVSRFGAQCINGIGFLGAGTIVVTGLRQVKGLTTAAGLWASACMGLAVGIGFYEAVIPAALIIFVTITLFPRVETLVMSKARNMDVLVEFEHIDDLGTIIRCLKNEGIRIFDAEVNKASGAAANPTVVFSVQLNKKNRHHSEVVTMLANLESVRSVEEL